MDKAIKATAYMQVQTLEIDLFNVIGMSTTYYCTLFDHNKDYYNCVY